MRERVPEGKRMILCLCNPEDLLSYDASHRGKKTVLSYDLHCQILSFQLPDDQIVKIEIFRRFGKGPVCHVFLVPFICDFVVVGIKDKPVTFIVFRILYALDETADRFQRDPVSVHAGACQSRLKYLSSFSLVT